MTRVTHVVFDNEFFSVEKRRNQGRAAPGGYVVKLKHSPSGRGSPYNRRQLFLSTDELFDLTEILDDICDAIEDAELAASR